MDREAGARQVGADGRLELVTRRREIPDRQDLDAYRREHEVIATRLFGGRTVIHVLSDSNPGAGFEPMTGGLEDVYFSTLAATRRIAA
jgi:hypothetical protein